MSALYPIATIAQLFEALEKANFTPEDIIKLKDFNDLAGVRGLLYGWSKISCLECSINLDVSPFIPEGLKLESHCGGPAWEFSPAKVVLCLTDSQKEKSTTGHDLLKEIVDYHPLNANVLDYLLLRPELIPEDWKNKTIYFWGTIYSEPEDGPCVRFLYWKAGRWHSFHSCLKDDFDYNDFAACYLEPLPKSINAYC